MRDTLFAKLGRVGRGGNQGVAVTFLDPISEKEHMQVKSHINQLKASDHSVPEFSEVIENLKHDESGR